MADRGEYGGQYRQGRPGRPSQNRATREDLGAFASDWNATRGALYVTVQARLTGHFLRRLEERGGNLERLVVENRTVVAEGWLRAVHDRDFNLVVPGFGQIRIRIDRYGGGGFVAVTFLPSGAS